MKKFIIIALFSLYAVLISISTPIFAENTTTGITEVNAEETISAAQAGNPQAQYNLGVMYQSGIGVNTDMPLALQWYHKAAAQGEENAQYNLGVLYLKGIGVEQNQNTAIEWFKKSAAQLNPSAIRALELLQQAE